MKLKDFIEQLNYIEKENGDSLEVRMADNIPVVEPVIRPDGRGKRCVIITDQK
jgi:hypothetical protein